MFEVLVALNLASPLISQSLLDLSLIGLFLFLITTFKKNSGFENPSQNKKISIWYKTFSRVQKFGQDSVVKKVLLCCVSYLLVCIAGLYFNANSAADKSAVFKFQWILHLFIYTWAGIYFFNRWFQSGTPFSNNADPVQKDGFYFSRFTTVFFILLSIPILYGFNVFFNDGFDLLASRPTGMRVIGLVNSATYHGILTGAWLFSFLVLLYNQWNISSNQKRLILSFSSAVILTSTIMTFTRGVWLSLLIAITVTGFSTFKKIFLSRWTFGVLILLLSLGLLQNQKILDFVKSRSGSDQCRLQLMKSHIRMAKEFPLLGIGYRDNLRSIQEYWSIEPGTEHCEDQRKDGNQAHNQYLNVLGTTGILGLTAFLFLHFIFLKESLRQIRLFPTESKYYVLSQIAFSIQIYYLATYLTESTFEYGKVRSILLVAWGMVLAIRHQSAQPIAKV